MRIIIFFIPLMISFQAYSQLTTKIEISTNSKTVSYFENKKNISKFTYKNQILVREEYFSPNQRKVEYFDNGKILKRITQGQLIKEIFKFQDSWVIKNKIGHLVSYDILSSSEKCEQDEENILNKMESQAEEFLKKIKDQEKANLIIDPKCLEKNGQESQNLIHATFKQGFACFETLFKESGHKKNGVLQNITKAKELLSSDQPVTISCSQKSYEYWNKAVAHASISSKDNQDDLKHPFISLNPDKNFSETELKQTVWHEFMHNLGYPHKEGIEYAYNCERCCFGEDTDPDIKFLSCRVCTGNYESELDQKYIRDLVTIALSTYRRDEALSAIQKYVALGGDKKFAFSEYTRFANSLNPVAYSMSKIYESRFKNDLSDADKISLKYLKEIDQADAIKKFGNLSDKIANIIVAIHFDKKPMEAVKVLKDTDFSLLNQNFTDIKLKVAQREIKSTLSSQLYQLDLYSTDNNNKAIQLEVARIYQRMDR